MKNNIDIVIFTKTESGDNNLDRIIANDIEGDIASILDEELGEEI